MFRHLLECFPNEKRELKQELQEYKDYHKKAEKTFKLGLKALIKLQTVLNQAACGWTPDKDNDEDFKKFHTACGHTCLAQTSDEEYNYFALEIGTSNIYCPYCGKGVYIKKGDIANVDSGKGQTRTRTQ